MLADQIKDKSHAEEMCLIGGPATVGELCALFEVSRSGFYAHRMKPQRPRRQEDEMLADKIKEVFKEGWQTYGCLRIAKGLHDMGLACGKNRASRLMLALGLVAKCKGGFKPQTTDSAHGFQVPDNLFKEAPATTDINQQWVNDITYIPTKEGWLYLAGTLDCHSRCLVGWQTSANPDSALVISSAQRALRKRRPEKGFLFHSDRGVQYASWACRKVLTAHGAVLSMSRKGNCYDNAMMESFWATLKTECFGGGIPATRKQARAMLFEYIEIFYNRKRMHSALGYLSPMQFEMLLGQTA